MAVVLVPFQAFGIETAQLAITQTLNRGRGCFFLHGSAGTPICPINRSLRNTSLKHGRMAETTRWRTFALH